jgi:hypothetical protein
MAAFRLEIEWGLTGQRWQEIEWSFRLFHGKIIFDKRSRIHGPGFPLCKSRLDSGSFYRILVALPKDSRWNLKQFALGDGSINTASRSSCRYLRKRV